jgi:hypothetical protein
MTTPHLQVFGIAASFGDELLESQWTETRNSGEVTVLSDDTVLSDGDEAIFHRPKMITVRVKDFINALGGGTGRLPLWIQDFHDDPIAITEDMFEVLVAYRAMKRAA